MNKIWVKTIFLLGRSFDYLIRAKEKRIDTLADFHYQCAYFYDAERIFREATEIIRTRSGLLLLKRDFAEIMKTMPEKYKTVLELKIHKKQYFWKIAEVLGCSLRNAIYVYNKALEHMRAAFVLRGYTDEKMVRVFGGDVFISGLYLAAKEREENFNAVACGLL